MDLRLVAWVDSDSAASLQAGRPWRSGPGSEEAGKLSGALGLPWSEVFTTVYAFVGEVPADVRLRNLGKVRIELDVPWILQDLKLAAPGRIDEEVLAQWALRGEGERRVEVLAGLPPSARHEGLLRMARRVPGVEVRTFRSITDDDIERYVTERALL